MKPTNSHPHRVLVADDQSDIRDALRLLLKREGYEIQGAASPGEALAAVEAREFDAVIMDLNYARDTTSGQEGLDLLPRIQMIDSTLPVIVMTAWSRDRKSTRLNSSHLVISYAVFCLKKKKKISDINADIIAIH